MTLTYIQTHLNTHKKCVKYLEKLRWKGKPTCPYCGSHKSTPKQLRHTCHQCKRSYSVTVKTTFHNSNLPLYKWLSAISIILSAKKGVSSLQLARDISVNKNTAWLLQMKIRAAMAEGEFEYFKPEKRELRVTFTGRMNEVKKLISYEKEDVGSSNRDQHLWNHLKRAIIGQYHRIDEHYLYRYVDEIRFKFDRKSKPFFGYEDLISKVLKL